MERSLSFERRWRQGIAPLLCVLALGIPSPAAAQDDAGKSFTKKRIRTGHPRAVVSGFDLVPLGYPATDRARVSAVDIDGDGVDEVAIASGKDVTVVKYGGYRETFIVWQTKSRGGATAIASGDIDDDGLTDLVVGWGANSEAAGAELQLVAYRTAGTANDALIEEVLVKPEASRKQFTRIQITPLEIDGPKGAVYAHYKSKYQVRGGFVHKDGKIWKDRELYDTRMATELAVGRLRLDDQKLSLVVGRPYGDGSKTPGDVYVLSGGKRELLPSVRGVRSLAFLTLGGRRNARHRICYGDGWHWKYREVARGHVTCTRVDGDGKFHAELIQKTQSYDINTLAAADLDGDGVQELIARGSKALYRYIPVVAIDGLEMWDPRIIGPGGKGFAVVDTNGDGRDELAIGGDTPALIRMR